MICGIRATARRVRPQPKRASSTADLRHTCDFANKSESSWSVNDLLTICRRCAGCVNQPPGALTSSCKSRSVLMGTCRFPMPKDLARPSRFGHISGQARPFRACRCSQGGVKVPTGGKGQQIRCNSEADGHSPDERERLRQPTRVSRGLLSLSVCPDSGPERGKP